MTLQCVSSHDDTLADNSPAGSMQLESFPPLFVIHPNVLDTPPLKLDAAPSGFPEEPQKKVFSRWLILSLSCLLLFGNYFGNLGFLLQLRFKAFEFHEPIFSQGSLGPCLAYDNPAALNTQLQKYLDMPYNDYQYLLSTLYSIYSLPNTVLPFFFGSLMDRFGPKRVLLTLSSCVCIGQTVFSIGVQSRQVWMMLLGRAIFGIGGESCSVAQASITTMHFRWGENLCTT